MKYILHILTLHIYFVSLAFCQNLEAEQINDDYYNKLLAKCRIGDSCCKASVARMRKSKSLFREEGANCPKNYIPDGMRCQTAYSWCEPKKDTGNDNPETN